MAAARRMGSTVLIAQTRKSLEKALRIQGFVEYRDMPAYAAGVESAIHGIEGLLESGEATAALEMCERGLNGLADALEDTDDSDGYINGLMEQLRQLHLQACQTARPDPEALGRNCFCWSGSLLTANGTGLQRNINTCLEPRDLRLFAREPKWNGQGLR